MSYDNACSWERKLWENRFNHDRAVDIMANDGLSDMQRLERLFDIYRFDIRQKELHDAIRNVLHPNEELRWRARHNDLRAREELKQRYAKRLNDLIKEINECGIEIANGDPRGNHHVLRGAYAREYDDYIRIDI